MFTLCCCSRKELTYEEMKKTAEKNNYTVVEYLNESDIGELELEILKEYNIQKSSQISPEEFADIDEIKINKAMLIKNKNSTEVFYAFWTEDKISAIACNYVIYTILAEEKTTLNEIGELSGSVSDNYSDCGTVKLRKLIGW